MKISSFRFTQMIYTEPLRSNLKNAVQIVALCSNQLQSKSPTSPSPSLFGIHSYVDNSVIHESLHCSCAFQFENTHPLFIATIFAVPPPRNSISSEPTWCRCLRPLDDTLLNSRTQLITTPLPPPFALFPGSLCSCTPSLLDDTGIEIEWAAVVRSQYLEIAVCYSSWNPPLLLWTS